MKDKIVSLRRLNRLSQKELAKKSGLSQSTIAHIETGNKLPSVGSLNKIAEALGVSASYLLSDGTESVEVTFNFTKIIRTGSIEIPPGIIGKPFVVTFKEVKK